MTIPANGAILAAADVDADIFRQQCGALPRLAERTTLYVSAGDRAVKFSSRLHGHPRAGFIPPVLVEEGIDTHCCPVNWKRFS
jgi:esterase/lipase superfamily enzyme